jgi:hypothetical protein
MYIWNIYKVVRLKNNKKKQIKKFKLQNQFSNWGLIDALAFKTTNLNSSFKSTHHLESESIPLSKIMLFLLWHNTMLRP